MNLLTGSKIKQFFPAHTLPCIKNFLLIIECILHSRTVCLYKCRDKVPQLSSGKIKDLDNCYARLIRFFRMDQISAFINGIHSLILNLSKTDLSYIIIDRSGWKRGVKDINLLMAGGLMNDIFMPFYWLQLNNNGGASNFKSRKDLIEGLFKLVKAAGRSLKGSILLADREFIGQVWFEYLKRKEISFVIRLRENLYFQLQTAAGKKNFSKDFQ